MSEPAAQLPSPTATMGPAFLCVRCQYNLHGLAEDGLSPECALPIRASREGAPLNHYPPQWLHRLAHAATLLAAGIWAIAGLRLVLLLNIIPYTSKVRAGEFPTAQAAAIVINVLLFIAYWLAATPLTQAHEPALSRRRMVRIAAVVFLAMELLNYTGLLKTRVERAAYFLAVSIVDIVGVGLLTHYLRRLAALLGQPGLALQLSVAFIGWAASVAATRTVFWAIDFLRLSRWRHVPPPPHLPLAEVAWWPFILYLGVVLSQFRFAFLKAAGGRDD